MHILIASDHAGFELKQKIIKHLQQNSIKIENLGPDTSDSVDYPDFAKKLAKRISQDPNLIGILICGTGIGMSITANRFKNVRAALCHNEETAIATRKHNNANVLCLGARVLSESLSLKIVDVFLNTAFEGGRHERRIQKIEC